MEQATGFYPMDVYMLPNLVVLHGSQAIRSMIIITSIHNISIHAVHDTTVV